MNANVREDTFGEVRLICNEVKTIDAFRTQRHATLRFRIKVDHNEEIDRFLDGLKNELPFGSGGEIPEIEIQENGYSARIRMGESWRIAFDQELCDLLRTRFDDDAWEVWYP